MFSLFVWIKLVYYIRYFLILHLNFQSIWNRRLFFLVFCKEKTNKEVKVLMKQKVEL